MGKRGNPNWGKLMIGSMVPVVTSFERVAKEYKLVPDQYLSSERLREWARKNRHSKYIPEPLLKAWGFDTELPRDSEIQLDEKSSQE